MWSTRMPKRHSDCIKLDSTYWRSIDDGTNGIKDGWVFARTGGGGMQEEDIFLRILV